jgi:hypothetical protein
MSERRRRNMLCCRRVCYRHDEHQHRVSLYLICLCVCRPIHQFVCMSVYLSVCLTQSLSWLIYTCIQTQTHTSTHIETDTHTHTHMCVVGKVSTSS